MKKLLVQSKGFMLTTLDGEVIPHDRPCVVANSAFIQGKIASGHVQLLDTLPAKATDEGWAGYLRDSGEFDLAKDSYLLSLAEDPEKAAAEKAEAAAKAEAAKKAAAEAEAEAAKAADAAKAASEAKATAKKG